MLATQMRRLLYIIPLLFTLISVTVWLGCDEYNVVEPRFYSEDDVVTFGDCDAYRIIEPACGVTDSSTTELTKVIPVGYMVDGCWVDRSEDILEVIVGLPLGGKFRVSILNSGGGIEQVLYNGSAEAGLFTVPWVAEEDGVYAISLETENWDKVLWFEVD